MNLGNLRVLLFGATLLAAGCVAEPAPAVPTPPVAPAPEPSWSEGAREFSLPPGDSFVLFLANLTENDTYEFRPGMIVSGVTVVTAGLREGDYVSVVAFSNEAGELAWGGISHAFVRDGEGRASAGAGAVGAPVYVLVSAHTESGGTFRAAASAGVGAPIPSASVEGWALATGPAHVAFYNIASRDPPPAEPDVLQHGVTVDARPAPPTTAAWAGSLSIDAAAPGAVDAAIATYAISSFPSAQGSHEVRWETDASQRHVAPAGPAGPYAIALAGRAPAAAFGVTFTGEAPLPSVSFALVALPEGSLPSHLFVAPHYNPQGLPLDAVALNRVH